MQVGDTVIITVSPDHGDHEGTIVAISPVPPNGDYPTYTVDVPAYGTFTRPADEVLVKVAVTLHMNMWATDQFAENAADIARGHDASVYGTVVDWEVSRG